jgi:ComF family protein
MARAAFELNDAVRRMILVYKNANERRLAPLLAEMLQQILPLEWRLWADALTWIPADQQAFQERGFDHMETIASCLGESAHLPAYPLLLKNPGTDQRVLTRAQRFENVRSLFSPNGAVLTDADLGDKNIILIDDVFTTGATLEAAADCLLAGGIKAVRVLCLARTW